MKRKRHFYFANPHSFKYSFVVYIIFTKKQNYLMSRIDHSKWIEVSNYTYYGEPVNCIIPAQDMDYEYVVNMLDSEDIDNVFGAINYLLINYRDKFLLEADRYRCSSSIVNTIFRYFQKDIYH